MNAVLTQRTSGYTWPAVADRTPKDRSPELYLLDGRRSRPAFGSQTSLSEVQKHYLLPGDDSVAGYLEDHPATIPVLLEAVCHLNRCFGDAAIFRLKIRVDEAQMRTLYVVVDWPHDAPAASDAFDRFDSEWWLDRCRQTAEYIVFTYKLV